MDLKIGVKHRELTCFLRSAYVVFILFRCKLINLQKYEKYFNSHYKNVTGRKIRPLHHPRNPLCQGCLFAGF